MKSITTLSCILISSLSLMACGANDGGGSTEANTEATISDGADAESDNEGSVEGDVSADGDAPCVPKTCGANQCSVIDNGCGLEMDCGQCPDGIICGAHGVPNECEVVCETLSCAEAGAECGTTDDGCGGTLDCGDCTDGTFCGASGTPNTCGGVCIPETCTSLGFDCGSVSDGCGEILACGTCDDPYACSDNVCTCETALTCAEAGAECGPSADGCGGTQDCGACEDGLTCSQGSCVACAPQCDGKSCGPDGCGGTCGTCSASKTCLDGVCKTPFCEGQCGSNAPQWCGSNCKCYCNANCFQFGDCCEDVCESCFDTFTDQCCAPECDGKTCGPDGCGGTCGECAPGTLCEVDQCVACEPQCDGLSCGDDQCGGTCGECAPFDTCEAGQCIACEPQCEGKECGSDGCGGSCGVCDDGQSCTNEQVCVDCEPQCEGKICGDNGCGGTCNDCTFDCNAISDGPFVLDKLDGPIASEDLAFDAEGNLIGSNDNAIFKSPYDGSPQVWVPNIQFRAGLRFLPTGDLVVNNDNTGQFLRVEPDGTIHVVLNNLAYPNGLAVHLDGWVVVTEHDAKRVLKVDAYENTSEIISQGVVKNPNGAAFNPDYSLLYIAGFSGVGTIYAFPVSPEGDVGDLFEWKTDVGTGWLDGIGVDICSNVYIADYYATKIFRFDINAENQTTVLEGQQGSNTYLPNMQWGSGLGGWDSNKLYLPDGWNKDVFEVDMGIPGIPKPYPPQLQP